MQVKFKLHHEENEFHAVENFYNQAALKIERKLNSPASVTSASVKFIDNPPLKDRK